MEADSKQLFFLKSLLNRFSLSIGLKVDFNKSMMVPISVSDERLYLLAGTFGCCKGTLPIIYLGLPLAKGLRLPSLVNKYERRLTGLSSFLNQARRLQIINAIFFFPTNLLYVLSCYPQEHYQANRQVQIHCLWRGQI